MKIHPRGYRRKTASSTPLAKLTLSEIVARTLGSAARCFPGQTDGDDEGGCDNKGADVSTTSYLFTLASI
jgi:hypothetical protein